MRVRVRVAAPVPGAWDGRGMARFYPRRTLVRSRDPGNPDCSCREAKEDQDPLPYWFRKNGLGPLIGTRTWGGLIGLSGNPAFVDGGSAEVPTPRIYDGKGTWIIENEGVSPDHEVVDLPESLL